MLLIEISNAPSNTTLLYRSIDVPVKIIATSIKPMFHNPSLTSHGGIWLARDKDFPMRYGKDVGGMTELTVGILSTYEVPTTDLSKAITQAPSEGRALKLPLDYKLPHPIKIEMLLGYTGNWEPYNKDKIIQTLNTKDGLNAMLSRTEIERDCVSRDPNCTSTKRSIGGSGSANEDLTIWLNQMCVPCKKAIGIPQILNK